MVLGSDDCHLESALGKGTYPLLAVQLCGVEECRIVATIALLIPREGVDAEVEECRKFHLLPRQLLRGRH